MTSRAESLYEIYYMAFSDFSALLPFIFFMFLYTGFALLVRLPLALSYRKKAKSLLPELFSVINATGYNFENLLFKGEIFVIFSGKYKTYKTKCRFFTNKIKNFRHKKGNFINIVMETKLTKSKISVLKFMVEYPKVYKDYVFDGKRIYLLSYDIGESPISRERAIELLDDMIKACELVENPDFKLNIP